MTSHFRTLLNATSFAGNSLFLRTLGTRLFDMVMMCISNILLITKTNIKTLQLKRKTKRNRVVILMRVKEHEYGIFNVVIGFLTVPLSIERADLHFRSSKRNSHYPSKGYFYYLNFLEFLRFSKISAMYF